MRFLVDECVPIEITKQLQARKFDIYDPRLKNTRGLNDITILTLASREKRIIVTRDLEFNLLSALEFKPKGIILLRFPKEVKVTTVAKFFRAFMNSDAFIESEDNIVVISPGGIRIRKLSFSL